MPGWIVSGERPPRPLNREILGLSDEVWLLMGNCWDGDPTVRPRIAGVLSSFEAASSRWVPPTSEAISDLGLDRPITVQRPPTGGSTYMELVDLSHCPTRPFSSHFDFQHFYFQVRPGVSAALCLLLVALLVALYFSETIVGCI